MLGWKTNEIGLCSCTLYVPICFYEMVENLNVGLVCQWGCQENSNVSMYFVMLGHAICNQYSKLVIDLVHFDVNFSNVNFLMLHSSCLIGSHNYEFKMVDVYRLIDDVETLIDGIYIACWHRWQPCWHMLTGSLMLWTRSSMAYMSPVDTVDGRCWHMLTGSLTAWTRSLTVYTSPVDTVDNRCWHVDRLVDGRCWHAHRWHITWFYKHDDIPMYMIILLSHILFNQIGNNPM